MNGIIQLVGSSRTVQIFGVRLIGVSADTGKKLLFTLALILLLKLLSRVFTFAANRIPGRWERRSRFWGRQIVDMVLLVLLISGLISIWFRNPGTLGQAAAWITAGLAVASQRVITALAGYLIILRSRNFNVGDRIVMGGVRGDVMSLGFMQTTIMEMGEPPGEQGGPPAMWVMARQYTGRIVTITNDKIFDNPVYNYTREFPYIWEEMHLPIPYNADRHAAERIILDAARKFTVKTSDLSEESLKELERRYMVKRAELEPRVYFRLTDNWVEMSVRFITEEHGIRKLKDAMSREILDGFDRTNIGIASGTYQVVGMPELNVRIAPANGAPPQPRPA
jgi:small-conductance mechanosensitive channel